MITPATGKERGDIEIKENVVSPRVPDNRPPHTHSHPIGQFTHRRDPIVFMSLVVNTSGRLYDDFIRLFSFHTHRET